MAGGEEKFLQKNLLAPYEVIAKNQLPHRPFLKMYLIRILMQRMHMLYKTTDEVAQDHSKINSCPYISASTKKLTLKMKRYKL